MPRPKEKRERALGVSLGLRGERGGSPKSALTRRPYPPGQHGKGRRQRRTASDFKLQLKEKQKFKLTYGITEKGLRNLFTEAQRQATRRSTSVASKVIELLERRLDNAVFHLGFAVSRHQARQFIVHGHITVGGRKVRSPGYLVCEGETIGVRGESKDKHHFTALAERLEKHSTPPWLSLDPARMEGKVATLPTDVETPFEVNLLVESFSR